MTTFEGEEGVPIQPYSMMEDQGMDGTLVTATTFDGKTTCDDIEDFSGYNTDVRTTPPILTNSNHDLKCVFNKIEEKCETHKCKLIETKVSSKKWLPDPKTKLYR